MLWLPLQALAAEPIVIVLSWDGVRHDYPERAETPALDRMARAGARAARLVPVFPSNTFPNHVALATGTYVDRHGIVGNVFRDSERGRFSYSNDASWIEAEPLWAAAERQGVRAAAFFWVGSETDWNGRGASYRRTPFDTEVPESEKVDQILAWLDLPEESRPRLIMSWWHGADHVGHERGPDDGQIPRQLARQDRELGRLLAGLDLRALWERTTLFVVSDHGMSRATEAVDVRARLEEHGISAAVISAGGSGYVFLEDPSQRDEAIEHLTRLEGVRAHAGGGLPAALRAYHPRRSGDVVVITEPPRAVSARSLAGGRGMHGYLPQHPDMAAIFYAMGRGIPAGLAPDSVRAIDLAATVSALLAIEPPAASEGRVLPGLLLPQPVP